MGQLEPVVDGAIWATERPVWFHGVRLRARSTVVRLEDGSLLWHSPEPPTDGLAAELDALGPVRLLVAPNRFHDLGLAAAAARYPEATVVAPTTARARNATVPASVDITADWAPRELEALAIDGVPFLDETALFHRPTGTLLAADLALSACRKDHWTWRVTGRVFGCYDRVAVPPDVRWSTRASDEAARSIERLLALPMTRLCVAHADPVEAHASERLAEAWRFVGVA